jgi:hypothetical protein
MNSRILLVGLAVGLFTTIAFGPMPAAATPCTNLIFLQLKEKDTTITSAADKSARPSPFLPCHSNADAGVRLNH